MNQVKRLGKNVGLITLGSFASRILSFLFVPLYTAVLSTREYGTADVIQTSVNLLVPLFTVVIYESLLRFALDETADKKDVFSVGMCILFASNLAALVLSPTLLFFRELANFRFLVLAYFVTSSCYTTFSYFCRGIKKITLFTLAGVVNTVLTVGLNLLFLLVFELGLVGYLYAYIISAFLTSMFLFIVGDFWQYIKPPKDIDCSVAKNMLQYSFPLTFNSISWWISGSVAKYIIIGYIGLSASGVYAVAGKIPSIISILGSVFSSAWLISAVEGFGSEKSKKFYSDVFILYFDVCVCASAGLILLSKILGRYLYSKDFFIAWKYTPILTIGVLLHILSDFIGSVFTASKKPKALLLSTVTGAGTCIIMSFALVKPFGCQGAAVATMLSYAIIFLYRLFYSRRLLPFYINYMRKVVFFLLLLLEAILMIFDTSYSFVASTAILLIILILCIKDIYLLKDGKSEIISRS